MNDLKNQAIEKARSRRLVNRRSHAEKLPRIEKLEVFMAALHKLNEYDQQIISLRLIKRYSNARVAEAMGLDESSASMRYLRAMRRLRNILSQ